MKRPSLSPLASSTEKHPKLDLPQAQLTASNDEMKHFSYRQYREGQFDEGACDDTEWRQLLPHVLVHLTSRLAETDVKASFISPRTLPQAKEIVEGFSEDEFKEWKDGLQKGVKTGDWADLIAHRTYFLQQIPGLLFNCSDSEASSSC
jgi:hypothetical protein